MNWFNILTLVIAGWGAVLSTLVAIWQWRHSGPRLSIKLFRNAGLLDAVEEEPRVLMMISNRGNKPTTITQINYLYSKSWISSLLHPSKVVHINLAETFFLHLLPSKLEVGDPWQCPLPTSQTTMKRIREGYFLAVVYHSHSDKGIRVRLKPKQFE